MRRPDTCIPEAINAMTDPRPLAVIVLGPAFEELPASVRQSHLFADRIVLKGTSSVTRGTALWPSFLASLFRFPRASADTPVTVAKIRTGDKEIWTRNFDGQRFTSTLMVAPDGMTERFGPVTFTIALRVKDGALHYPVKSARIGPVPLPAWLLPVSVAKEFEADGVFHFDVALYAPLTRQLMVHYRGRLAP
ncbi:MAG: DUF4166 domain-containing protein [Pseudomonadota bacterium]